MKITKPIQFTAHIEFDEESSRYIGYIPAIPEAQTFADSIDDLNVRLKEVLELCLEEMTESEIRESVNRFIGTSQVVLA